MALSARALSATAYPYTTLFRSLKNSAMARAGILGLRRNVAVYAGAAGDAQALSALREVDEPTCDDPVVAGRLIDLAERRRSDEHTSELQSHSDLAFRLLLVKNN